MSVIHNVRVWMESNEYLEKLVPLIRNAKILERRRINHMQQDAEDRRPGFQACYLAHREEFDKVAKMLADEFSRKTFQTVIAYRLAPCIGMLERGGGNR